MNPSLKKTLFVSSLALNAAFVLFVIFSLSVRTTKLSFFLVGARGRRYLHSGFIVSVPEEAADVLFGPVEFSLRRWTSAAVQFSLISGDGRGDVQSNLAMDPLYDHSVVEVKPFAYGLVVTGLSPGETTLQVFSSGSFRDIARVRVWDWEGE